MGAPGRVLVVTNDFPPRRGGIETFVLSLCMSLPSDAVVVYTAAMPHAVATDADLPFPVIRDRARTLLPTPRVKRRARDLMARHNCDQVVFGAAAPLGLLAPGLRRAGARTVIGLTHGHEVWWAKAPGARQLLRRIGESTDTLTFVSDFCRREIAAALTPAARRRMARLSPGVDLRRFAPGIDGAPWRQRLGVGPERPVVLSASRLVRRKGHDTLLRAWPTVLATCPDAVLVIVGSGPRRRSLERMVSRLGIAASVHLAASVPWEEMAGVYAAADVFALPCRTRLRGLEPEAWGMVFVEAAACGLPVVVGRSGGAPETVIDGQTGHVVDPRDTDEVARRIGDLVTDRAAAQAMGAHGREWVEGRFATDDAAETLNSLLGR